ncbi:LOB domain-containing protein 1-like [Carex rostrata]
MDSTHSNDTTTTTATTFSNSNSSNSLSPASPPTQYGTVYNAPIVVLSPCAACKILRRRCVDKCVLAPYFPPTEPHKFTTAHRVFGASNIIKLLQELPESQRADAVSSMVYEANARIRDPVYGCAGAICQLQKQVSDLQAQLARSQAELVNVQAQHTNLVALICMEMAQLQQQQQQQQQNQQQQQQQLLAMSSPNMFQNDCFVMDEACQGSIWDEPLWV